MVKFLIILLDEIIFLFILFSSALQWFNHLETGRLLTVRDFLSWVSFVNLTQGSLEPEYGLLHGAFLVLLDGLSLGICSSY